MFNLKQIAIIYEKIDIKKLIEIVFTRKDTKVPTGNKVEVTGYYWQEDSSGYGGENVPYTTSVDQQRVVLNNTFNEERLRALKILKQRGNVEALKLLISSTVQPVLQKDGVVIDDTTFEDQIAGEIGKVIEILILRSTPEDLIDVFKEEYRGQWNASRSYYLCGSCFEKSREGFQKAIEKLAQNNPDYLAELYYQLTKAGPHPAYGTVTKVELKDYGKIILDVIDDVFLSRLDLRQLAMLYVAVGEYYNGLKAKICAEMERRNITTKEIPEIIRLLREGTYALENYLYELVAKDAIRNFDKYSLRDLIELYSNLGKHGYVSESKEKIFQEIKRRITVKDAVDIVNNGFGSALPYGILEVKKIVFKQIAENSTNEEVDGLDVHKFNNLLSDILSDNNRTPDEQITARYRYPINSLVGDIAKAEKAREELIKYGAKKISEKFLRRLVTVLRDDDVIGHDIGIAVLFAAIGTPICIEGLFKVLDLLSDNLADNRGRLIYTRLRRMSLVLNILKDQEILYSILTDLEALYTVTELVFSRIHIDDKKETTFVLAQIAQIMERSARDSVKRRRTFMEWLKGERPWAKRKIRKTLAEIEKVDRLILYHGIMDRQYPILCSYRNVVSPIPREVMEAIAGDLERILRDINNPYFDYFELLRKPEILNYISAQRIPLALSFFAALIENMYKELKNYGDWHYSYQAINNIIDAIVQYGGAEALELLIRIKKLNWISLKFDVRAGYIRRHLKEAIAKLEARQG